MAVTYEQELYACPLCGAVNLHKRPLNKTECPVCHQDQRPLQLIGAVTIEIR